MKVIEILGLIIFTIILLYMVCGYYRFVSTNDGYKIIQVDDLNTDDIYKYMYMKYPLVVLNTINADNFVRDFTIDKICEIFGGHDGYYSIQDDNKICHKKAPKFDKIEKIKDLVESDTRWKCLLNHTFIKRNQLYNPIHQIISRCSPKLSLNNRYSITISSEGFIEPLQYSQSYKIMITSIRGNKTVRIFNPSYKNSLYMDSKFHPNYRMSRINIWDDWEKLCKRYKKIKSTQFIDIKLREGNTLLIPNFWLFSTKNDDINITLYSKVDTVLTHILQLPYSIEKTLHYMGLYKVNKCYCHKSC